MLTAALVLAVLASALHGYIFYLEAFAWTSQRARDTFGTGTVEQAEETKFVAFNQGFYNLFLAVITLVGVAFTAAGETQLGVGLIFAGAGSMLAAALVLGVASPPHRRAAAKQGVLPLLTVLTLIAALAT